MLGTRAPTEEQLRVNPTTMPAAFIGHGNPMNTLEHNRFTGAWAEFGRTVGRPRAVLAISAHWYIDATAVTSMGRPKVIHDFSGFPKELFDFDYPARGAPELAAEVAELAQPVYVDLDATSWGIDHGTWSVLAHVFPDADVPVVQLSIDATQPLEYHIDLGARLAPLLDEGVLVLASGNVVHNLRMIDWQAAERGFDWAERFDAATRDVLADEPAELGQLIGEPDFPLAVPTPDHFLPLAYLAGIAAETNRTPDVLVSGCTLGSLSMTSYTVGGGVDATD